MAKDLMTKTVIAAAQEALKLLLPEFDARTNDLKQDVGELRRDLLLAHRELDDKIEMRFDQARDVMNQLGERMARVKGEMSAFVGSVNRQSDKMDKWIERLVQVETTSLPRRRGKRAS